MKDIEVVLSVCHKQVLRHILTQLCYQIPHRVQQVMSGERTPILCGAIPAFEIFMSKWDQIIEVFDAGSRLVMYAQAGLEWAHKYYACMDRTQAYIITMCKCLCLVFLPQIIKLTSICSAAPSHSYDMDHRSLGEKVHL